MSQRFGHPHSQIPSVLGIPFSYYCSVLGIPRYPPGMPKSLVLWSSPPKNFGFHQKIENVLKISLKKGLCGKLYKARQNDSAKICQKVRVWLKIRVLVLRGQGEGWHSASESATLLLFLDTPAAIILLRKSKSGFTGLTTTRTRWKWLVTNFIYLPMHHLDRGFLRCPRW